MSEGTVKWFNEQKGYGFIDSDDGPDVFVHFSDIMGDGYRKLAEGDVVEYEVVQGEKGPKAAKVVRKPRAGSTPITRAVSKPKVCRSRVSRPSSRSRARRASGLVRRSGCSARQDSAPVVFERQPQRE